jgi:uncharacterized protein (TIRG00374 family)
LRAAIGVAISVAALGLVISRVDLTAVGHTLVRSNPLVVAGVIGATCLDLVCRTFRWQALLDSIRRVRFVPMLGYLLVGYLGNNLLPARLGELVRSHYLGDREGLSRATVLGTIVVERVVDTAVLVAIASAAIVLLHVTGLVASLVLVGLGAGGLLVIALATALVAHRLPFADRFLDWVKRWPTVHRLMGRLGGGLAVARQPRTLARAVLWSCLAWAATVGGFAAAGRAVGVDLTWGQAALLGAAVALSTAIPAGPGYVGTFELAGVQVAAVFGIPANPAFALALLAHGSSILVTSIGGAIALAGFGWRRSPTR